MHEDNDKDCCRDKGVKQSHIACLHSHQWGAVWMRIENICLPYIDEKRCGVIIGPRHRTAMEGLGMPHIILVDLITLKELELYQ